MLRCYVAHLQCTEILQEQNTYVTSTTKCSSDLSLTVSRGLHCHLIQAIKLASTAVGAKIRQSTLRLVRGPLSYGSCKDSLVTLRHGCCRSKTPCSPCTCQLITIEAMLGSSTSRMEDLKSVARCLPRLPVCSLCPVSSMFGCLVSQIQAKRTEDRRKSKSAPPFRINAGT